MFQTIRSSHLFAKLAAGVVLVTLLAAGIGLSGVMPVSAAPTTYYIDCVGGNDANNGTSTSTPWKTFANVNSRTLVAGDSVLLKRGVTCVGIGSLVPKGSGTPASPITIGDYGTGALPKIDCGTGSPGTYSCVFVLDYEGYVIQNLEITGTKVDGTNGPAGVYIESHVSKKSYFRINNIVAHDMYYGISISAYKHGSGGELANQSTGNDAGYLDDVIIDGGEMYNNGGSLGNGGKGIHIVGNYVGGGFDPANPINTNITVRNVNIHDNPGDGIVMTATDGGLMEYITANHNGASADDRYGIWPWNSKNVTTQFSEAAFNETSANKGGGGFDCDYNVWGCVFQYSYSHDNQGPGQLMIGYGNTNILDQGNIRYNLFVDNCWHPTAPDCGDAVVFGTVKNTTYHNNTIYFKNRNNNPATQMGALELATWGKFGSPTNFQFKNNIVHLANNTGAYWQGVGGTYTMDYNILYAENGNLNITWGKASYSTLAAFQAATGQDLHSSSANPLLAAPGGRNATDYQIPANSPAVNAGVDLGAALMGNRDYFGNTAPQGGAYDIGFYETGGGGGSTPTPTRTSTPVPPTNTPGGPTNTPTPTSTPTNTPVPPTPTNTPGPGTIAFVKTVGTASCGSATNVITVPASGVAAGNTLVVRVTMRAGTMTGVISVSDSKGNTYTADKDITNANVRLLILSANVATALVSGDTITASYPPVNPSATGLVATEFSGIVATNRVDVSASATGTSTTPSVSATTTNAKDLVYGAIVVLNNPTVTEASGWTLDTNLSTGCGGAGGNSINHGAYKIVSATGSHTYNPTLSIGNAWVDEIVAYKGQ